jgi:cyclopropane-fatty-acyl-phospholipid synthase
MAMPLMMLIKKLLTDLSHGGKMLDQLLQDGLIPDPLIRFGINGLLKKRLKDERRGSFSDLELKRQSLIQELKKSPIAIETDKANDQHYQVPTEFYDYVLGKYKKYSSCFYKTWSESLDEAEENMLNLYLERGQFQDGQEVLDMGCGWGSFSLFAARKFSKSKFTLVSNSKTQRAYIEAKANEFGLSNIRVITEDMNRFDIETKFDRIISVEMFEHMRNYKELLAKINRWLKPEGKLFVHIFVHKELTYKFDVVDDTDWMSKYFFSGGIMPSEHLLYYFQDDLKIKNHWRVSGLHYAKTASQWLENQDKNKDKIMEVFTKHYGKEARKWFNYWRVFFMSCENLWRYDEGAEWFVSHYLFEKS